MHLALTPVLQYMYHTYHDKTLPPTLQLPFPPSPPHPLKVLSFSGSSLQGDFKHFHEQLLLVHQEELEGGVVGGVRGPVPLLAAPEQLLQCLQVGPPFHHSHPWSSATATARQPARWPS